MYGKPDLQLLTAIDDWVAQRLDQLCASGFTIERRAWTDAEWAGNCAVRLEVKHPLGEGEFYCWAKGDCETNIWLCSWNDLEVLWTEINSVDDVLVRVEGFFTTFTELSPRAMNRIPRISKAPVEIDGRPR